MVGVSRNAVALAALVSVLLTHGCYAQQHLNYTSLLAKASSSPWIPAKATWYGAPTGAGPDDNGRLHVINYPHYASCASLAIVAVTMLIDLCMQVAPAASRM
jgi:hypothetical protein